jgi:hypothetical protein
MRIGKIRLWYEERVKSFCWRLGIRAEIRKGRICKGWNERKGIFMKLNKIKDLEKRGKGILREFR